MGLHRFLTLLVLSLPVLVVAFGVLMGAYGLALALQDPAAAVVFRWVAIGCLCLFATNIVLLVGALGIHVLGSQQGDEQRPQDE